MVEARAAEKELVSSSNKLVDKLESEPVKRAIIPQKNIDPNPVRNVRNEDELPPDLPEGMKFMFDD